MTPLRYAHGSRFFHAAGETGFVLRELEERDWVATMPKYERYLGWPITHFSTFVKCT